MAARVVKKETNHFQFPRGIARCCYCDKRESSSHLRYQYQHQHEYIMMNRLTEVQTYSSMSIAQYQDSWTVNIERFLRRDAIPYTFNSLKPLHHRKYTAALVLQSAIDPTEGVGYLSSSRHVAFADVMCHGTK